MKIVLIQALLLSTCALYSQPTQSVAPDARSEISISLQLNTKVRSSYLNASWFEIPQVSRNLELNLDQSSSSILSCEVLIPAAFSRYAYFLAGGSLLSTAEGSSSVTFGKGAQTDTTASVIGYLNGGGLYVGIAVDPSIPVSLSMQAGIFLKLAVGLFSFDQKSIVNLKSGDRELIPPSIMVHTVSNVGSKLSIGVTLKLPEGVFRLGGTSYLASTLDAGLVRLAGIDLSLGMYF